MIADRELILYVSLIGVSNGLLFSYYGEAPLVFSHYLKLGPFSYAGAGLLISASFLSASSFYRYVYRPRRVGKLLVLAASLAHLSALSLLLLSGRLEGGELLLSLCICLASALVCFFFSLGVLLPLALAQMMIPYQDQLGRASSLASFSYYLIVSLVLGLTSYLHDGSPRPLLLVFTALSFVMFLLTATQGVFRKSPQQD